MRFNLLFCVLLAAVNNLASAAEPAQDGGEPIPASQLQALFGRDNLVAWCIVPFDAKKRGPQQRAMLLKDLGFKRFAYDWRGEHIPTFDAELQALKAQGIRLQAFWFPAALNDEAKAILAALKRNDVKTELWVTMGEPAPQAKDQAEKVAAAVRQLRPIVDAAAAQGCSVGLYNHGGWFGEPENQIEIIASLKAPNVGIVYNQHHGHDHVGRFAKLLKQMQPHLYALNLNGMIADGERKGQKIVPLGQGELDLELLRTIAKSGYRGPIGILGHTQDDAAERLADNLDGLDWLVPQLAGKKAAPLPTPRTYKKPAVGGGNSSATQLPGWLIAGRQEYRSPPLTLQCRARLTQRESYNILVASDTKASGEHWELFSMAGSGTLTVYLPGYQPDHVRSDAMIADDVWHTIAMQFEADRVRLYLDGRQVADQKMESLKKPGVAGDFALGRLVEGGIGCQGELAWVHLTTGVADIAKNDHDKPPAVDKRTLGFWQLDAKAKVTDGSSLKNDAVRVGEEKHSQHHDAHDSVTDTLIAAVPSLPAEYDAKILADLVTSARLHGNARRGREVFAAARFACSSCHQAGTVGGQVGPALTDVGKRLTPEQLAEALLWPAKTIKPEFIAWQVSLNDGRTVQGYKVRDTKEVLELRTSDGKTATLARDEVESLREIGTLMPANLASSMSSTERRDVLRFLIELGHTPELADGLHNHHSHNHEPAKFTYDKQPLQASDWPYANQPVNRERLYDFYTKEANYFRAQSERPLLLPAYPGLDGGPFGHWGIQKEDTWRDDRWNQTELGSVMCGVFHAPGRTIPKAICVNLGERFVAFNPETASFEALWTKSFLTFSSVRHGFMDGLKPGGPFIDAAKAENAIPDGRYRGFMRDGDTVTFIVESKGSLILQRPVVKAGELSIEAERISNAELARKLRACRPQWPQEIQVRGTRGSGSPYAIDDVSLPSDNPWKALVFPTGHDFAADGSAYVCTMTGDVWHVRGLDSELQNVRWRRFASGLHQPLGLVVDKDQIYVIGRDQITRLHDANQDGEADFHECFSNVQTTSPSGHDYICGLERDAAGNCYTASSNQGLLRFSPDGQKLTVLARGFRNPDGLGLWPDGSLTVPCSEGEWTPASMLCSVQPNDSAKVPHFGHGGLQQGQPPALPLVYLPRGLDNSCGGQIAVPDDRWGPLRGKMVHLSFGACSHFVLLKDEVAGQAQGAIVPLIGDFKSGGHRGRFSPVDGQLYVTGMNGWGSYASQDGCLQRVRYTGAPVQLPHAFHVHENGVKITFTQPNDAKLAGDVSRHFAQVWNYRYGPGYGSPELSPSHPGVVGHDLLDIAAVHLLDERTVFVEMPDLQPVNILHLSLVLGEGRPQEMFITVHKLDAPFTKLPNYQPLTKTIAAHPLLVDLAMLGKTIPNPWRKELADATPLEITTGLNLTFAPRELKVKAGQPVKLTFINPDAVPHNWVLIQPGKLLEVGDLTNKMVADPAAVLRHYVPKSDDVLAYTDIVPAGQRLTIYFQAPTKPGRYPYLCTFPGHWMVMNGELVVASE